MVDVVAVVVDEVVVFNVVVINVFIVNKDLAYLKDGCNVSLL